MINIVKILLVEDDELDVIDIKRNLDKLNITYQLTHARNGEEALYQLCNHGANNPLPDIVLLDINMPKMNGLEFLQVVRDTPDLQHLKCFVISTSDEKPDKDKAKKLGISGYIIKPFKINNAASMDAFNLMIDLMNLKTGV
jgi:CheY-like chemotaxis protein